MKIIKVETAVGQFSAARESIILHRVEQRNDVCTFHINVDAKWVTNPPRGNREFDCVLQFKGVISMFQAELDTYYATNKCLSTQSCFEQIEGSPYLRKLKIREDYEQYDYKHYRLWTYDDVFDIIATSFTIDMK